MKKFLVVLLWIAMSTMVVVAQQRLVNEVKKEISGMTLTVDNYKNSSIGHSRTRRPKTKPNPGGWQEKSNIQSTIR